eukprot:gene17977-biopygen34062
MRLIAVYRRPNNNISETSLVQLKTQLTKRGRNIVVGDLNMDARLPRPSPQPLWNTLIDAGLTQRVRVITHPPRHASEKASTIDHIWVPSGEKASCSRLKGELLDGTSDHHAIQGTISAPKIKTRRTSYWTRDWGRVDPAEVAVLLHKHGICPQDPQQQSTPRSLGALLKRWHAAWNCVKAELAPRKFVIMRTKPGGNRLQPQARHAIRMRSQARIAFLENKTAETKATLKEARRAATLAIRQAKGAIIKERRQEAGKDVKACWRLRRELAGKARPAA